MAVKKTELYSLLWEAANKLRGGVEPARYRDLYSLYCSLSTSRIGTKVSGTPISQ